MLAGSGEDDGVAAACTAEIGEAAGESLICGTALRITTAWDQGVGVIQATNEELGRAIFPSSEATDPPA